MAGLFGNMFDMNRDGKISGFERAMEFHFMEEMLRDEQIGSSSEYEDDEDEVCPNCGKKIVKQVEKSEYSKDNIFQIENDGNACLIVGYKGFKDKKIVIPSSIHGRTVIGIWNNVFEKCEITKEPVGNW